MNAKPKTELNISVFMQKQIIVREALVNRIRCQAVYLVHELSAQAKKFNQITTCLPGGGGGLGRSR